MAESCLFCRISRGELPVPLLAESAKCVAFRDISPQAPKHFLVVPREHFDSLNEISDLTLIGEMMIMARDVAAAEGINASGYRTVVNTNADGGQSVSHVHVHVLGGRKMHWPPG